MIGLIGSLLLFGALHLLPALPDTKAKLKSRLGKSYGPAFGLATLAALILVLWTFRMSDRMVVYDPPEWGRHANFALTLLAFVFLGIFAFRGSWRNAIRYPLFVGILLWGAGHLLANGDSATLTLVTGLAAIAALHVALVRRTFSPSVERKGHNLMSVLFGIAFYGVFAQAHGALIGVPVLSLT